ncbi:unnamed protein product, partial [Staurois parvus]
MIPYCPEGPLVVSPPLCTTIHCCLSVPISATYQCPSVLPHQRT